VLWTRLAPFPLEPGGGLGRETVKRRVARRRGRADDAGAPTGSVAALPELGHSVHVELSGLASDRPYWYHSRWATR
jgi:alkaline phosphatase D